MRAPLFTPQLNLGRALVATLFVSAAACAGDGNDPAPTMQDEPLRPTATTGPLTTSERVEYDKLFGAAVCVCRALLGEPPSTPNGWAHDPVPYATIGREANACAHGYRGMPPANIAATTNSACAGSVSSGPGFNPGTVPMMLCGADFEYCLGHELAAQAQSLVKPPSTPRVKARLLGASREHVLAASIGYVEGLAVGGTVCTPTTSSGVCVAYVSGREMSFSSGAWSGAAWSRLAESIDFATDVTELEVFEHLQAGDAQPSASSLGVAPYAEARWGRHGAHTYAAQALYGVLGPTASIGRRDEAPSEYVDTVFEIELPSASSMSPRVRVALELMDAYRVPHGAVELASSATNGGTTTSSRYVIPYDLNRLSIIEGVASSSAIFNYLDHLIAASLRRGSYADANNVRGDTLRQRQPLASATDLAWYASNPLADDVSPLRTTYRVREADVRTALSIAADRVASGAVGVSTGSALELSSAASELAVERVLWTLPSAQGADRSAVLKAAFSRDPSATYSDPIVRAMVSTDRENAYHLHRGTGERFRESGLAGALQVIRAHLARMAALPSLNGRNDEMLTRALASTEASLGDVWFETNWRGDASCSAARPFLPSPYNGQIPSYLLPAFYNQNPLPLQCPTCPSCDPRPASTVRLPSGTGLSRRASWDVYTKVSSAEDLYFSTGRPLAFKSEAEAACFLRKAPAGCTSNPEALTAVGQVVPGALGGRYRRRRFSTELGQIATPPTADGPASGRHRLIYWVHEDANGAITDERLVDVQDLAVEYEDTAPAELHAFGGTIGGLFGRIMNRNPFDPVEPATSSLGIATSYYPPVGNELASSTGGYLERASVSTQHAAVLLKQARDAELAVLQSNRSNQAALELAANALEASLSPICGDDYASTRCVSERAPDRSPLSLGIASVPVFMFGPLRGFTPELSYVALANVCPTRLANLDADFPTPGTASPRLYADNVLNYLDLSVACQMWEGMKALESVKIKGLPLEVVEAFEASKTSDGIGDYPRRQGQLRELYIAMHEDLATAYAAHARVQNAMGVFRQRLALAEANMQDRMRDDAQHMTACRAGRWLGMIRASAKIATSAIEIQRANESQRSTDVSSMSAAELQNANDRYVQNYQRNMGGIVGSSTNFLLLAATDCDRSVTEQQRTALQAYADAMQTMGEIQDHILMLRATVQRLTTAGAVLDGMERDVAHTYERASLQRTISRLDSLVDQPLWRVSRMSVAVRAQRQLRQAQRDAFIARRAIDFRLAIDMRRMVRDEILVEAPARWVSNLFALPTAITPGATPVSVAPEALSDYTQALTDFMQGYGLSRSFVGVSDVQVLDLQHVLGPSDGRDFHARFLYKCRNHPDELLAGTLDGSATSTPCAGTNASGSPLGGVEYARLDFYLSPRGDGYAAQILSPGNHNYRYEQFAINFVGSGLKTCDRAANRDECGSTKTLRYTLEQSGLLTADDLDGVELILPMPTAFVRNASGLANETVLGIPLELNEPEDISTFYRSELWGRPLEAVHTLRIEGRPEINWAAIGDIQILLKYSYWTMQD